MNRLSPSISLLVGLALALPSASATGYLVNVQNVGIGFNVFGGDGDTIDAGVGAGGDQCSDEDDFVDVGIANTEGGCAPPAGGCQNSDSTFDPIRILVKPLWDLIFPPTTEQTSHCSDDGDTVDVSLLNSERGTDNTTGDRKDGVDVGILNAESVDDHDSADAGVLNVEGSGDAPPFDPTAPQFVFPPRFSDCEDHGAAGVPAGTDQDDGVDVGVLNTECDDDRDANDAGVLNCERSDADDGLDAGVLNWETIDDHGDTFDASILNAETGDNPDGNGLNVILGINIGTFFPQTCSLGLGPIHP